MATERMLGIVGGVGPESTADYYRRLIGRWRERGPTGTYPSILIDSLNSKPVLDSLLEGNLDPTVRLFEASVARLAGAGAQLGLVASVTMHLVFDQVAAAAPIPMLSILEALVNAAREGDIRRPGVIATRPTTEGEFFARPFEAAGIELIRPEETDLAFIHQIYFDELVKGNFTEETRARLVDVIERMKTRHDLDAIILGGTELPLILDEPTYAGVPVLDATGVHVEAAIDWLVDDGRQRPRSPV
jgi:aspartate racemase